MSRIDAGLEVCKTSIAGSNPAGTSNTYATDGRSEDSKRTSSAPELSLADRRGWPGAIAEDARLALAEMPGCCRRPDPPWERGLTYIVSAGGMVKIGQTIDDLGKRLRGLTEGCSRAPSSRCGHGGACLSTLHIQTPGQRTT